MESLFVLLLLRRGITIVKSKIRKSRIVEWLLLGIVRMILLRRRVIIRKGLMLQGSHQLKLWLLQRYLLISMMIMLRMDILCRWNSQREINCFCSSLILVFLIKQLLLLVMFIDEVIRSNSILKIFKMVMKMLLLVIILNLMMIIQLLINWLNVLLLLIILLLYLERILIIVLSLILR